MTIYDAIEVAFFLESLAVEGRMKSRKLWHHQSRRGFSDQNPIGCSQAAAADPTANVVLTINQYSIPPSHHIPPSLSSRTNSPLLILNVSSERRTYDVIL